MSKETLIYCQMTKCGYEFSGESTLTDAFVTLCQNFTIYSIENCVTAMQIIMQKSLMSVSRIFFFFLTPVVVFMVISRGHSLPAFRGLLK